MEQKEKPVFHKRIFWDVNFENLDYDKKYSTQNLLISIPQVMVYFQDADEDEDLVSLKGQTWKKIQKTIQKKIAEHLA